LNPLWPIFEKFLNLNSIFTVYSSLVNSFRQIHIPIEIHKPMTKPTIAGNRFRSCSYALTLVPGLITLWGNGIGGAWAWSNVVFVLVVVNCLEWIMGHQRNNEAVNGSALPDFFVMMAIPMVLAGIVTLLWGTCSGMLKGSDLVGAVLSTGFSSGSMGIVAAHEMIHRKKAAWKRAGDFLLFLVMNAYFAIDHLRVHHRHVATSLDHASARYGEHFYRFLIRSIRGQFMQSLELEAERLRLKGQLPYGPENAIIRNSVLHIGLSVSLIMIYPMLGIVFAGQAFFANILLEYTNYIEHYGLERTENERVRAHHSWQSDKPFSRFMLYDLSRHADHHLYGGKPYFQLKTHEDGPTLPGGYAGLIVPVLIPPLWFTMIHPKIKAFQVKRQIAASSP
jgi:alkane 1-monooxygenase